MRRGIRREFQRRQENVHLGFLLQGVGDFLGDEPDREQKVGSVYGNGGGHCEGGMEQLEGDEKKPTIPQKLGTGAGSVPYNVPKPVSWAKKKKTSSLGWSRDLKPVPAHASSRPSGARLLFRQPREEGRTYFESTTA